MATAVRQVMTVRFFRHPDRTYDYEIPDWVELTDEFKQRVEVGEGALAVVDSPFSGYDLVEVESIRDRLESDWEGPFKPVVALVDVSEYERHLSVEERAEAIKRELRRRAVERDEMRTLEELAQGDPEMEALVTELRQIS